MTSIETSNSSPLLGQPFELTLSATTLDSVDIQGWIELPIQIAPLQILEESPLQITDNPPYRVYQQSFTAVIWQVGTYITPDVVLSYSINGEEQTAQFAPINLFVQSVINDDESAMWIPDIANQDLYYIPIWIWAVIGTFILLLVVALISMARKTQTSPTITHRTLIDELNDLRQNPLEVDLLYPLIKEKLRLFLQEQLNIVLTDLTTTELMARLHEVTSWHPQHLRNLNAILDQVDLVQFAQYRPLDTERYILGVINWVKQTVQHPPKP